MLFSRAFLVLIVMVLCWSLACSDKEVHYVCDGILQDKPLANIRACVVGNWQMHYRKGGIGLTKQTLTNTFVNIRANDSIYFTFEGVLRAQTRIEWKDGISLPGTKTYTMNFHDNVGSFYVWVVERIYSDTLVFYDEATDPFGYYMTKNP